MKTKLEITAGRRLLAGREMAAPARPVAARAWQDLLTWLLLLGAGFAATEARGQLQIQHSRPWITAGDLWFAALATNGTVMVTNVSNPSYWAVESWTNLVTIEAGYGHLVGLRSNGTVVATGSLLYGSGNVGGWSNIVAVAAGYASTLGLRANGTVVAAGWAGDYGLLVGGWSDIVAVGMGQSHSVGVRADGSVVAAGPNTYGECAVYGWSNIIAVACGDYHTLGLKADGTVVATGDNSYQQCNVANWTNVIQLDAFSLSTVGLRGDGICLATGEEVWRQTGIRGTPGVVAVAAAEDCNVALRANGSVVWVGRPSLQGDLRTAIGWNAGPTATNGYAMWTKQLRLPPHRRVPEHVNGPLALPNLLAYASALDPYLAQPSELPRLAQAPGGALQFIFRRSATAVGTTLEVVGTGVLPAVEWLPVPGLEYELGTTLDGRASLRAVDLPTTLQQEYFRQRATLLAP